MAGWERQGGSQALATGLGAGRLGKLEIFEYPAGPEPEGAGAWEPWGSEEETADVEAGAAPAADHSGVEDLEAGLRAEFELRLGQERRRAEEAGREEGRQEGRLAEREASARAQAAQEQERRRQAAELTASFAQERDRYLQAVEREVVQLALAVAARILRREAQMDPLLLTGAVRVALGQLAASTEVRLLVPGAERELWAAALALVPNLALKPAVVAGEGMRLGDCRIETELGSVDLGIRAQLGEIERGFFDRAGGARSGGAGRVEPAREAGA